MISGKTITTFAKETGAFLTIMPEFTLAKPLVAFATEFSGISYYTWDSNKHIAR